MKVEKIEGLETARTDAAQTSAASKPATLDGDAAEASLSTSSSSHADAAFLQYRRERIAHWDAVARWMRERKGLGGEYRRRLAEVYKFFVPPGKRVLEIGCAQGDLLAALEPSSGVGLDFSGEMIEAAKRKYPALRFLRADMKPERRHQSTQQQQPSRRPHASPANFQPRGKSHTRHL